MIKLNLDLKRKMINLKNMINKTLENEDNNSVIERWNVLYGELIVFLKYEIQPEPQDIIEILDAFETLKEEKLNIKN